MKKPPRQIVAELPIPANSEGHVLQYFNRPQAWRKFSPLHDFYCCQHTSRCQTEWVCTAAFIMGTIFSNIPHRFSCKATQDCSSKLYIYDYIEKSPIRHYNFHYSPFEMVTRMAPE